MAMSTSVSSAIARAIARLGHSRLHPGHYWISAPTSAHGVGAVGLPATTAAHESRLSEAAERIVHPRSAADVALLSIERPLASSRHFADESVFGFPLTPHSAGVTGWAPKSSPLVTQLASDACGVLRIASLHPGFLRALEAGDAAALREARRCAGSSSSSSSSSYSSWSRRQRQRGFKQRRLTALGGRFAWSMAVAGAIQAAQLGDEAHAAGTGSSQAGHGGAPVGAAGGAGGPGSSFGAPQMRNGLRFDQSSASASLSSLAALLGGAFGSSAPGAGLYGPPALFRNDGSAAGGSSGPSSAAAASAGSAGSAAGPGSDGSGNGPAGSNLLAGLERAFADNHELAYQLGIGSVAGFCSGYAVKKVSKVVAFTVGVGFIAVQLAHYWGYAPPVSAVHLSTPEPWHRTDVCAPHHHRTRSSSC